jgi:hypothetical protein
MVAIEEILVDSWPGRSYQFTFQTSIVSSISRGTISWIIRCLYGGYVRIGKKERQDRQGSYKSDIATSALAMRIDYNSVRLILSVGTSYSLIQVYRQSSQSDKAVAWSIVSFLSALQKFNLTHTGDNTIAKPQKLFEYVEIAETCPRSSQVPLTSRSYSERIYLAALCVIVQDSKRSDITRYFSLAITY